MTAAAPVILLHGFAQTPASWNEVARLLQARGHRAYALDLYARVEDGMDTLCQYVADTVRQVAEVEGAPVLVGYSMGGRVAVETLVRHGFQPLRSCEHGAWAEAEESTEGLLPRAGLVQESAGLGPSDEAARAALAERNAAWAARLREEGVDAFMDWWETLPLFATQQELPAETRAAIRVERTSHSTEVLAHSLEAWGAHHQATESETIAALSRAHVQGLPFLYIAGERDEKYAAVADRLQTVGLPVALISPAGHNTHLEDPAAFAELLACF